VILLNGRLRFQDAFSANSVLSEVLLSTSLTSMSYGVFYYCQKLTAIAIPT
jgi:hypothetical protein